MIRVEKGGEYKGETYIWCIECSKDDRWRENGGCMFEGDSFESLIAFITEHRLHDSEIPKGATMIGEPDRDPQYATAYHGHDEYASKTHRHYHEENVVIGLEKNLNVLDQWIRHLEERIDYLEGELRALGTRIKEA